MNAKALREALTKTPFRPIEIETKGGKVIPITHPENMFLAMEDTMLIVSAPDHIHMVDAEAVASVRMQRRKQAA